MVGKEHNKLLRNLGQIVRGLQKNAGKEHNKLLRDIRECCNQLSVSKIGQSDFFEESTYKTDRNREYPCYNVTKKGREFNQPKIGVVDFFQESTCVDNKGETRPCYDITKKGCEFIVHKLTGIKEITE